MNNEYDLLIRRYSIYDGIETEKPNVVKREGNGVMSDQVKRIAKYYNQCKLPKWATVLGVVLLAFGIVAAGVTAIFHDKYSSIFWAWESALTNVWFIAFIALVGVGALISLGYSATRFL